MITYQALNVERNSFQHQFERGELSEAGVTRLTLMWESLQVSLTEGGPAERQRRYEKCIEKLEQETSVMRSSKLKEGWRKVNGDSGTYYQHKVRDGTRLGRGASHTRTAPELTSRSSLYR